MEPKQLCCILFHAHCAHTLAELFNVTQYCELFAIITTYSLKQVYI